MREVTSDRRSQAPRHETLDYKRSASAKALRFRSRVWVGGFEFRVYIRIRIWGLEFRVYIRFRVYGYF